MEKTVIFPKRTSVHVRIIIVGYSYNLKIINLLTLLLIFEKRDKYFKTIIKNYNINMYIRLHTLILNVIVDGSNIF